MQLLHIRKSNHISLQYATTLLQKLNQGIKLGFVRRRLFAYMSVVWMPFSELTVSFILNKAEGKEDMGDELLLRTCRTIPQRVANYRKEISPLIEPRFDTCVHRNLGTYRFCFGGS